MAGLFVWGFTAALLDRLLTYAGWEQPWDRRQVRPLPAGWERTDRVPSDRARTARPGTVAGVLMSKQARRRPWFPCPGAGDGGRGAAGGLRQRESAINREPHPGSTTASATAGVQEVVITTDHSYRFKPSTITVHPGKVRITLKHVGTGAPHDWSLQGFPADYVPLVTPRADQIGAIHGSRARDV